MKTQKSPHKHVTPQQKNEGSSQAAHKSRINFLVTYTVKEQMWKCSVYIITMQAVVVCSEKKYIMPWTVTASRSHWHSGPYSREDIETIYFFVGGVLFVQISTSA